MTNAELIARLRDEHVAASRTEAADRIEFRIRDLLTWDEDEDKEGRYYG